MKILRPRTGRVVLVGAGPGDPELLTVKAVRCLSRADVVIYDRLVDSRVLDLIPDSAEAIPVGKKGGHYGFPQEKIHELMASRARAGKEVVRLQGGDPLIFGRGGEEMEYLSTHRVPFEIVPGVSAAFGVPTAAGIPLTHRELSSSVLVLSGHRASGTGRNPSWELAARADTVVFLMPLGNLKQIISQLVLHGRPLDTPAAVIGSGTLESQQETAGTLSNIFGRTRKADIRSPALLVVGEVVRFQALRGRSAENLPRVETELAATSKQP